MRLPGERPDRTRVWLTGGLWFGLFSTAMRLACAARGRTQALPARRRHSRGPCRRSGTACASGEPPRLQPLPEEAEAEGSTKAEASVLAEARGVAALQFALSREGVALQLKETDDLDAALR